jgi:hypothetical protein
LGKFELFSQFQKARRQKNSYRSFLKQLQKQLTPMAIEGYFPGLRQHIEYEKHNRHVPVAPLGATVRAEVLPMLAVALSPKKAIYNFVSPGTAEFVTRLNVSLGHYQKKSSKTVTHVKKQDGLTAARSDRGRCIV